MLAGCRISPNNRLKNALNPRSKINMRAILLLGTAIADWTQHP